MSFNQEIHRRSMLAGVFAAGVCGKAALSAGSSPAFASQNDGAGIVTKLPEKTDFVIRNAYVMTMDQVLGDLGDADVHVRSGAIAAVGPRLTVSGAEEIDGRDSIVLPGFIDTHWHLWGSSMRGLFGDTPETSYFQRRTAIGKAYDANDMYFGTLLGVAEAIHSGITCVSDFCHNTASPLHVEACLRALHETGFRARYNYGQAQGVPPEASINLAHLEHLHKNWAQYSSEGLLDLGIGWRGMLGGGNNAEAVLKTARLEYDAARRLGLPISVHASGSRAREQMDALLSGNFLQSGDIVIHATDATPEQLRGLAEAGAAVSLTPFTELRVGYGLTFIGDFLKSGVRVGLGVDSSALGGNADYFAVMKNLQYLESGRTKNELAIAPRKLLELATIEGARVLGIDNRVGSISPGKRGDIIMVSTMALNMGRFADDPSHLLVEAGQPANVSMTVIDGRILKRGGKLTAIDEEKVIRSAAASIRAVRSRM